MRVHAFFMKMVVGIISFLLMGMTAGSAGFPEKPIQFLVGWPVGNVNDTLDRAIAKPLSKILKQPVIIQNIPGATGSVMLGRIKTEKADGYSLFQTGLIAYTQIPWMRDVPYHPLKDFAYLAQHIRFDVYMVVPSDSPWKTFEELIQYVKKNPKKLRYSTSGYGSSQHIIMEYLGMKENLVWIHVPYNGSTEAITALLGGHVDAVTITIGAEVEYVKTGRLRPLLNMNEKPMWQFPNLPGMLEKGYDFTCNSTAIWTVPANTLKNVQKILEEALLEAIADPETREVIQKLNLTYARAGSEEVTKAAFNDYSKFGELMKKLSLGIYKK